MAQMIAFGAIPDFNFDSAEYRFLFERSGATAFQHPDWLTPIYRHLASAHSGESLVICGRDSVNGSLVLVIPLIKRRVGKAIVVEYASRGVTDYACPILAPEALPATTAGFRESVAEAIGPYDVLEIQPIRQDHLRAWSMLLGIQPQSLSFGTHAIEFGSSFDAWRLATLKSRRRNTLDRKVRRLTEIAPISLEVVEKRDIGDAFRALSAFRNDRFPGDPLQEDCGYRFYVDVASRGAGSGLARTYRLTQGGTTIAVLFGVIEQKRFCYLLLGCDYERYRKFSPGQIMFDRVMYDWAEQGGQIFDFTIGDEPFKKAVGCRRTPLSGLFCRLRHPPAPTIRDKVGAQ